MTSQDKQLSIHKQIVAYSILNGLHLTTCKNFEKKFNKLTEQLFNELHAQKEAEKWIDLKPGNVMSRKKIIILTSKHTYYIAKCISYVLESYNFEAPIIHQCDTFVRNDTQNLYLVLCPNIFKEGLPPHYFAYQFEQTISSRWFTDDYIAKLDKALSVLDYSLTNINYLQNKNIAPKRVFYAPVAPIPAKSCDISQRTTDILFYGDNSCPRRQTILKKLAARFNIRIVNNLFCEEMQKELDNAKIVLNIHYYEGSMLETPRLCEAISRGCLVVSETSINDEEYPDLSDMVDFAMVDDVSALGERLEYWLTHPEALQKKVNDNQQRATKSFREFSYYIARMLLNHDLVSFEIFYRNEKDFFPLDNHRICLGLPESIERQNYFKSINKHNFRRFPAVVHNCGWIGCAMSYKFLAKKAIEEDRKELIICEDDVYFPFDFAERASTAEKYFKSTRPDILSGFIVDLHPKAEITSVSIYDNLKIATTDKVVSMVYAIYNSKALKIIAEWDDKNRNCETNAIDRYLEQQTGLKVAFPFPFLVEHNEDLVSVLSDKQNNILYDRMLKDSISRIESKLKAYMEKNK